MNGEPEPQDLAPPSAAGGLEARAEVDTSAPFKSVREAVDHFGGSAAWSSHLIRRMFATPKVTQSDLASWLKNLAVHALLVYAVYCDTVTVAEESFILAQLLAAQICGERLQNLGLIFAFSFVLLHKQEIEELNNLEEQTAQLEKELTIKERETLDVLKELESTKKVIADLKLKVQNEEACTFSITKGGPAEKQSENVLEPEVRMADQDAQAQQAPCSSVLKELEQAKANLNRTTSDLAAIRASIESLQNDIAKEKVLVERSREKVGTNTTLISSLEDELDQTTQKLQTLRDLQRRRQDPSDIFIEIKKMTSELEKLRNTANALKSEAVMLLLKLSR